MAMNWYFKKTRPGDTSREATGGEFFSNDSLKDGFPQALIREGIQNSLDARVGDGHVHVRIFLSEDDSALRPEEIAPFAESLFPHLNAPPNNTFEPPQRDDVCPFLVFEDFSTTGLEGNVQQWSHSSQKNAFFAFMRAEGVSEKVAQDSGRWGIGKFVFPRSSRARTFFAVTVRKSDEARRQLLMGRAILHGHHFDGAEMVPDGYFGETEIIDGCDFVVPSESAELITQFSKLFRLNRGNLPGLSVVVPWYLTSEITAATLAQATIREYFLPILMNRLTVEIATPIRTLRLDREALDATIESLDEAFAEGIGPLLALARFAASDPTGKHFLYPQEPNSSPKWSDSLIPDLLRTQIKIDLGAGKPVAIRVPISVRQKHRTAESSYFDVYITQSSQSGAAEATFVRGDITVPGQKAVRLNDHCALVVVKDRPISTLLGDAENPSHIQWNKDTEKFRGKYDYGHYYLPFVRQAAKKILEYVYGGDSAADPQVLSDVFFRPAIGPPGRTAAPREKGRKGIHPPAPKPPFPPRPARFLIRETDTGFSISPGPDPLKASTVIEVRVAYDVRSGDPFAHFDPADFSLNGHEIRLDGGGAAAFDVLSENSFRLRITNPAFRFTAKGFDPLRDLVVKARITEQSDDDATA